MTKMEAHAPLRVYALKSCRHNFILPTVTEQNRKTIVYSDVGFQNVPIAFRADGIVLFDFPKVEIYAGGAVPAYEQPSDNTPPVEISKLQKSREEIRNLRYRYMNAFSTFLRSSINYGSPLIPPVNPNRYIMASSFDNLANLLDNGAYEINSLANFDSITIDKIQESIVKFRAIPLDFGDKAIESFELFYRAAYHKDNHEESTALIILWAIIERAQNRLWQRYINGGYKTISPYATISGQRKKTLLSDRNYTAAIKTQILALGNIYSDQEVEWLDRTRKIRNDFMHSLTSVEHVDVVIAQLAAARLLNKNFGFEPKPLGGSGSWDYTR